MNPRKIAENVWWMGAIDWDRRLFDSLIPLPDGTSYNCYLVEGTAKTALLDTVDPTMTEVLLSQLENIPKIDYVISHHAEQDHSGAIPTVLEKYPNAKVVCTPKAKEILIGLLHIPEGRFQTVNDGDTLSLGGKTLRFIYTPWVHWPETMVTYLEEDKILFTCDFFGSHLATTDLYAVDEPRVYEAAKRYYAEIMMPFHAVIQKNLEKIKPLQISAIAPSHGPVYNKPEFILDAYADWVSGEPKNIAVIAYVSMHGSTKELVEHLTGALAERGVGVERFDLSAVDLGKLAMALVDAGTIIIGTPAVLVGPHPSAAYATFLANALKPKAKFASIIGSYSWGCNVVETLKSMLPNLKVELLPPVMCKGKPRAEDFKAIVALADAIAEKHRSAGLIH